MHLDAPFRQLGRHHVAGALLLEAEFGMGVQVAPPFGHLRRELGDAVDDRHEVLRVAGERRAEYRAVGLLLQPDTQPANRPRPMREPRIPIVSTGRLTLRGFETADQPAYAALRAAPDVDRQRVVSGKVGSVR